MGGLSDPVLSRNLPLRCSPKKSALSLWYRAHVPLDFRVGDMSLEVSCRFLVVRAAIKDKITFKFLDIYLRNHPTRVCNLASKHPSTSCG